MLKGLCLAAAVALPWMMACSSDEGSPAPPAESAGAGQGGEAAVAPGGAAGQASEEPGAGGGEGGRGGAGGASAGGDGGGAGTPATLDCGAGQICFSFDGEPLRKGGGGYLLTHQTLGQYAFVKYEQGADQLSIEIYSLEPGTFEVMDVPTAGAARVAWYSNDVGGQRVYQGRSGSVTVTELKDGHLITGAFAAELELTEGEAYTGETRSVTSGTFNQIFLPAI